MHRKVGRLECSVRWGGGCGRTIVHIDLLAFDQLIFVLNSRGHLPLETKRLFMV